MKEETETLTKYDRAIGMMPKEVLEKRHREYIEFCNKYLTPIKQKMHMIEMAQSFVIKPGPKDNPFKSERVVKWTPESRYRMQELEKEQDAVYRIAENKFWKGYEHLKPESDEI